MKCYVLRFDNRCIKQKKIFFYSRSKETTKNTAQREKRGRERKLEERV